MRSDCTTHSLKRTLSRVASTSAIMFLFAMPMHAHALSCVPRHFTLSEAYEEADSIIVGLVTECKQEISRDSWANGGSDCSFVSLEVLKESIPARDYRGVASSAACGLSLRVGDQYLLFLDNENRPMHFSATLTGERSHTQLSHSYVSILRNFRDRIIRDLSEPWLFAEYNGTCFLSHIVGGNQIKFSRRKVGAPKPPEQEWTRETVDGKTIMRSNASSAGENSTYPVPDMEVVLSGDFPTYPVDAQALSVSLRESPPVPKRNAKISVGSQSWSLDRRKLSFSFRGMPANTLIEYLTGGEVSEQILSAMTEPSDIIVTAVLVNEPMVDSAPPPQDPQPNQGQLIQSSENGAYFGQALPGAGSSNTSIVSDAVKTRPSRAQTEPPKPVIRLETRSTQLPAAVERFKACHGAADR